MSERAPAALAPRFAPGQRVAVRRADVPGHLRTPWYIRGHVGTIERLCGAFANPEELAYNRSGLPAQPLYRVRFRQNEVWTDYTGPLQDTVEIEIYQHWLEGV
ncbi:MAG TPA: SH3-like domain-containing protein [Stellaceae bacterium]|nr:SH3-like domain-containing protein [Stellaceae bacterium]